jgi:hypothetical protein
MYCTLQEAYNIPSFTSKKKKGCMNPLASTSQVDQSQSPPIAKVSADAFDIYDSYTPENGREHALAMNLQQNATLPQPMPNQMSPSVPPSTNNRSNKDSPIWGATQGMVYNRSPENFDQKYAQNATSGMNDIPYNSQQGDYNYYCNTFGICANPKVGVEGFANPDNSGTSVPQTNRYPNPNVNPNTNPQMQSQDIMFSKNGPPTPDIPGQINMPYYGPNPMGKCAPLQAPPYEIPMTDAARAQYAQAMDASLNQQQGATQSFPYPIRKVNMKNVAGYYDEELENFLTTQSMKSEKLPEPLKESPKDLESSKPVSVASSVSTPAETVKKQSSLNYIQSPQYIMDLLLFIAAGILVILLCDQIFKLGMSFGMRDTVKVLMPYLQELKITAE